jgi:hypothetical protein
MNLLLQNMRIAIADLIENLDNARQSMRRVHLKMTEPHNLINLTDHVYAHH